MMSRRLFARVLIHECRKGMSTSMSLVNECSNNYNDIAVVIKNRNLSTSYGANYMTLAQLLHLTHSCRFRWMLPLVIGLFQTGSFIFIDDSQTRSIAVRFRLVASCLSTRQTTYREQLAGLNTFEDNSSSFSLTLPFVSWLRSNLLHSGSLRLSNLSC